MHPTQGLLYALNKLRAISLLAKRTQRNASNRTFLPFGIDFKAHAHDKLLFHTGRPGLCKVHVGEVRLWMTIQLES